MLYENEIDFNAKLRLIRSKSCCGNEQRWSVIYNWVKWWGQLLYRFDLPDGKRGIEPLEL